MRSGPIALRAAGAALVLVLAPSAGTALAHDGVQVTVGPSAAAPGGDIDVRVTGCEGATGAAKSPAFVADAELSGAGGGKNPLSGGARVRSGVEEGAYEVSVTCDGHDHAGVGTIKVGRHQKPTGRPTGQPTNRPATQQQQPAEREPAQHQANQQQADQHQADQHQADRQQPTRHASPVAPVRAGGGGAAAFAAPAAPGMAQTASEEGLGTPYTLLGFGMAALAAVAVAFRSARRHGGSGSASGSGSGPGSD
ncbi:hypothetical protein [Streptomyces sp. NPDC004788]